MFVSIACTTTTGPFPSTRLTTRRTAVMLFLILLTAGRSHYTVSLQRPSFPNPHGGQPNHAVGIGI